MRDREICFAKIIKTILKIELKIIQQVKRFKYLDVLLSSYEDMEGEVVKQIVRAIRIAESLNDTI